MSKPRELHITVMTDPERGIVYDMAKCEPEIFTAKHMTELVYVRREDYEALKAELDRYSDRYRQIELANKEMTRNDHATFGKLLEENASLRAEAAEVLKWKTNTLPGPGGKIIQDNLDMIKELTELKLIAESLRQALRLYADKKFYEGGHNTDGGHAGYEIDNYGDTARKALEGKGTEK